MKTSGGFTQGRGMMKIVSGLAIVHAFLCRGNDAMSLLTGVMYHTSEQHKETTKARQERDYKDTNKLTTFLSKRKL